MSHNPFDRSRGSIFSHRTGTPDPDKYFRRATQPDRIEKPGLSAPTLFDVQDYFAKSGKAELFAEIHGYDLFKVEEALLDDLKKSTTPTERTRIRQYLLAVGTQAFPVPEQTPEQIAANIAYLKTDIERARDARRAASDDTEIEDEDLALCDELNFLIRGSKDFNNENKSKIELLEFIEDKQRLALKRRDLTKNMTAKRTAMDYLMHLRLLRDGAYWRCLYPHVQFPSAKDKNAA